MSPTIDRIGPYRFFFFGNEGSEPPHLHVQRERKLAKFWLSPVHLAHSTGFAAHELGELLRMVTANEGRFLEAWHEFFGH